MITKELKKKIDFLHHKIGKYEWSGELITREEGTINDLDDWKIIAEDIYLADIGSPGYTEYEMGKGGFKSSDVIELYEKFPKLEDGELKLQHIHSHNVMSCFFSGTDWENLEDRASISNYFLMLIVNFDGKYCAKVAFKAKTEGNSGIKLHFANNEDGYKPLTLKGGEDKDILVVMDCKIQMDEDVISVDEEFEKRYEAVKEAIEKEKEEKKQKYVGGYNKGWKQGYFSGWTDEDELANPKGSFYDNFEFTDGEWVPKKKIKKISEMTDKEFQELEELQAGTNVFGQDTTTKFGEKHARAFLNSIMDSSYMMENYKDLRAPLLEIDRKFSNVEEMEHWVDDWQEWLAEHFDVIFHPGTKDQYKNLMEAILKYLRQYKNIRLVGEMIKAVQNEIEMLEEESPIIY